jgi:uncharacterized protein
MTAGPTIDYEALAQDAMRGVVRTVLTRTAKTGLPGDHHFFISFDTQAPGVSLSKRLKEKYAHEMTIVLQHRFWDLSVTEDRFEVKLSFDGLPERLVVPFAAIKVFFDPSVRYGLQFEEPDLGPEAAAHAAGGPGMPDAENFPGDRGGGGPSSGVGRVAVSGDGDPADTRAWPSAAAQSSGAPAWPSGAAGPRRHGRRGEAGEDRPPERGRRAGREPRRVPQEMTRPPGASRRDAARVIHSSSATPAGAAAGP